MGRPLRVIQVGLGTWGRDWAWRILAPDPRIEVVAWVDPDPNAAERVRRHVAAPAGGCFADLSAALAAVPADAAVVTAALAGHVPAATAAIDAGLHVLVEKPFTATIAEARALVAAAAAKPVVLLVSQNYRHFPAARAARALVADGTLGPVQGIDIDFRALVRDTAHRLTRDPDPLLSDMAIHHFDLMRFVLADEPLTVACTTWNPVPALFAHDPCATLVVRFRRGAVVSYRGSWVSRAPATLWAGQWWVEGRDGGISWTARASGDDAARADRVLRRSLDGEEHEHRLPEMPRVDREGSVDAFLALIDGEPVDGASTGADNVASLALVEAAILSARRQGCAVALEEVL